MQPSDLHRLTGVWPPISIGEGRNMDKSWNGDPTHSIPMCIYLWNSNLWWSRSYPKRPHSPMRGAPCRRQQSPGERAPHTDSKQPHLFPASNRIWSSVSCTADTVWRFYGRKKSRGWRAVPVCWCSSGIFTRDATYKLVSQALRKATRGFSIAFGTSASRPISTLQTSRAPFTVGHPLPVRFWGCGW